MNYRSYIHRKELTLDPGDAEAAIAIIRRSGDPGCYLFADWRLDTDLPESAVIPDQHHWAYFTAYYLSPKLVRLGYPIAKWNSEKVLEYEPNIIEDIAVKLDCDKLPENTHCLVYRGTAIAVETIAAFLLIIQTRFGGFKTIYGYRGTIYPELEDKTKKVQDNKQLEINLPKLATDVYTWKVDLNEDNKKKKEKKSE